MSDEKKYSLRDWVAAAGLLSGRNMTPVEHAEFEGIVVSHARRTGRRRCSTVAKPDDKRCIGCGGKQPCDCDEAGES